MLATALAQGNHWHADLSAADDSGSLAGALLGGTSSFRAAAWLD